MTCDMLQVTCDMLRGTWDMWYMACDTWHVTHDMWNMTCDPWHVTHDIWHMTHDTWHMTCETWWGWMFSQNYSFLALMVLERQCFKDWEEKDQWLDKSVNDKGVSRTALATPVLVPIYKRFMLSFYLYIWVFFSAWICTLTVGISMENKPPKWICELVCFHGVCLQIRLILLKNCLRTKLGPAESEFGG